MSSNIKLYIPHLQKNSARKSYISALFEQHSLSLPEYITQYDAGEFDPEDFYTYEDTRFRDMLTPIKDVLIAYADGLSRYPGLAWKSIYERKKSHRSSLDQDMPVYPWIAPKRLSNAEISVFLKHRLAWRRIAANEEPFALVAEDDI